MVQKKILVQKYFWSENIFGPRKNIGIEKFVIKKKILVTKKFWTEKAFGKKTRPIPVRSCGPGVKDCRVKEINLFYFILSNII